MKRSLKLVDGKPNQYVWEKLYGHFPRLVLRVNNETVTSVFTDGTGLREISRKNIRHATKNEILQDLEATIQGIKENAKGN